MRRGRLVIGPIQIHLNGEKVREKVREGGGEKGKQDECKVQGGRK